MKSKIQSLALVCGAAMMVIGAPVMAKPTKPSGGGGAKTAAALHGGGNNQSRSSAKTSVNRPGNDNNRNDNKNNRNVSNNNVNVNKNVNVNVDNNNNRHGHYDNGRWYDDDDGLGFAGKVAVTTAAVAVTAAVVGSVTNTQPDNCQQVISNGTVYMYCNGTYYQPMYSGSNTSYMVVNPPR